MGNEWSALIKANAFGTYGLGVAKAIYEALGEGKYKLVKTALAKHSDIEDRLGDLGITEWPQEERDVNGWFDLLTFEQDDIVNDAFREINEREFK